MRRRMMIWTTLAAFFVATVPMPGSVVEAKNRPGGNLSVPIVGTVDGVAGTLSGNFSVSRFARANNQLVAIGTLSATVSDATGTILRTIVTPLVVPVTAAAVSPAASASQVAIAATCPIFTSSSARSISTCSVWSCTSIRSCSTSPRNPARATCSGTCCARSPGCSIPSARSASW